MKAILSKSPHFICFQQFMNGFTNHFCLLYRFFYFSRKKIHFFLDSNENCCTFAVFYLTITLTQNTTI